MKINEVVRIVIAVIAGIATAFVADHYFGDRAWPIVMAVVVGFTIIDTWCHRAVTERTTEGIPYRKEEDRRVKVKNTCIPHDDQGRTVPEIVFAPRQPTETQKTPEKEKVRC